MRRGGRLRDRYGFRSEAPGPTAEGPDTTEPNVFGEKADYWEIYNEVTDTFDEDMMEKLHIGLDNLLIFVSVRCTLV